MSFPDVAQAPAPNTSGNSDQKAQQLSRLNRSFFKHISKHIKDSSSSNWSIAMSEYLDHAKKIEAGTVAESATSTVASVSTPSASSGSIPKDLEEHVKKIDGYEVVHVVKSKLYKFVTWRKDAETGEPKDPAWVGFGVGYLQVLKPNASGDKPLIILARDDATKKIVLNTYLLDSTTVEKQGNKDVVFDMLMVEQDKDPDKDLSAPPTTGMGRIFFRVKDSSKRELLFSAVNSVM